MNTPNEQNRDSSQNSKLNNPPLLAAKEAAASDADLFSFSVVTTAGTASGLTGSTDQADSYISTPATPTPAALDTSSLSPADTPNSADTLSPSTTDSRTLARIPTTEARNSVILALQNVRVGSNLGGYSREWLAKAVVRHGLSQTDLEGLLEIRLMYKAGLTRVLQLYDEGLDMDEIAALYGVRADFAQRAKREGKHHGVYTPSITAIYEFAKAYGLLGEDASSIVELLDESHQIIDEGMPFEGQPSASMETITHIRASYDVADARAAALMVPKRVPLPHDSAEPQDPMEDPVERPRDSK